MNDKLDLNLMLALEALLAERNVTRAAKLLNLSQPALSSQLRRLRVLIGDPLFLATSRGVLPTQRALEMQGPLRTSLNALRELIHGSRDFDPAIATDTFVISATDYVQIVVLLPLITGLRSTAQGIRFMVRLGDSRAAETELERGDVHLAFLQPENVAPSLRARKLFEESYVGIERRAGPARDAIELEEFTRREHVIVSPRAEGFRGPTDVALESLGLSRNVGLAVSSFVFLIEAIAESDMVAMAPRRLVQANLGRVRQFTAPISVPTFTIAMAWHDRCHRHPGHTWLRDQVLRFCERKLG
jgi:DNA-binding transcriptional LysR family regulator